ncbi:MAG: ImmA/IrrE family metallo-endopeptidase [Chloroflexi bacterium]|nr:ImmA/IrrE family metallo-endopeptidase [Chloroflexota bacterium]
MATEAFITGPMLRWARERDGLSVEDAAKSVDVTVERVLAWEDGEQRPTLRKAQALAHKLNIPFTYLFLSEPPTEEFPVPDLRTVSGQTPSQPSPELLWIVNDALSKQEWYRAYLLDAGATTVPFIGSFSENTDPLVIAESIRSTLSVDDDMRARATSWDNFLTRFVRQSEAKGVTVLRSGIVGNNTSRTLNVSEFRGFAIVDEIAPLVFVNSRDAKVAQIFSLAHEIAHLWIAESGVSNLNYRMKSAQQPNSIERVCDKVAAEILVPAARFLSLWNNHAELRENLDQLTRIFRVSRFVLLRQAFELGKVGQDDYWAQYDEFMSQSGRGSDEGGNFYNNLLAKSSARLTEALLTSLAQGSISYREAAQLLNVKVGHLDKLRDILK